MIAERLKTAEDFERERVTEDNLEVANAVIGRLKAFVTTWRDYWYGDTPQRPAGLLTSMRKASRLLPSIGGKILALPQANESGKKEDARYKFLLILNNGMNWQNLHIVVDQQALWATLEGILDAISKRMNGTISQKDNRNNLDLYGQEPEWFAQQANGILTHALQLRAALEMRADGDPLVPIAITPLAERAFAAAGYARTRDEWMAADSPENFWWASYDEYMAKPTLEQAFARQREIHGGDETAIINAVLDWNISVQLAGQSFVDLRRDDFTVAATISTWFSSEATGKVRYLSGKVSLHNPALPETMMQGLRGPLDKVIDHWITKDLGMDIVASRRDSGAISGNSLNLSIQETPGRVLLMPWFSNKYGDGPKAEDIRNPLNLRKR